MSSSSTFGTVKRVVAILTAIAIVLAAGVLVGQAPAIFGVEEEPEASITFEDQRGDGAAVTVESVTLSDGGYVVLTDGGDQPLAVSERLDAGTHEEVTVEVDEGSSTELIGQLTATVHRDTSSQEGFAYAETDGEEDQPYLENGFPVSDTATVTTADGGPVGNSFLVESFEAPGSATTNETINVSAEISNPTEFTTQQNVDVRLDGEVVERQPFELEAGESREVTFEVDAGAGEPGTQTIGVYTDSDGAIGEIDLEFHTDPVVEVTGATDGSVTVDAAIPADGYVAVTDADGEVIGTSDALESGEHENVSVEFGEDVDEEAELTAVLYEGDPADVDAASPLEYEGQGIETTFTVADAREE